MRKITLRKDGRYCCKITENGKSKYIYGKSENEVLYKLEIHESKQVVQVDSFHFADYIYNYIKRYKENILKNSTVSRCYTLYNSHIRNCIIKDKDINNITITDIQNLLCDVANCYSKNEVKKLRDLIKQAFEKAVELNYINRNIVSYTALPVVYGKANKPIVVLNVKEIAQFNAANYLSANYFYYFALVIILNTGMRISEFSALQWNDVNFDMKYISINKTVSKISNKQYFDDNNVKRYQVLQPKTSNSVRIIPMTKYCEVALRWYKKYQKNNKVKNPNNLVVCSKNGNYTRDRVYTQTLKSVLKELNIKKSLTPHQLRHSFATLLIEQGVDVKTVSELLGHSDTTITNRFYVHPDLNMKFRAISCLNDLTT